MDSRTADTQARHEEVGIDRERAEFEAAQREDQQAFSMSGQLPIQLSARELSAGLFALFLWFGLFSGGILIATEPHRTAIATASALGTLLTSWAIVLAFWTITNIGILSCVAAFLGALGRRTRFTSGTDALQAAIDDTHPDNHGLATYYVSAIMRGFGVYALVLAGLLVLATNSLTSPDQESYMRLAPTVSIISFYAGYDPSIFAGLLDRVRAVLHAPDQKAS